MLKYFSLLESLENEAFFLNFKNVKLFEAVVNLPFTPLNASLGKLE